MIRDVLHEAGKNMFAARCERLVGIRRNHAIYPQVFRDLTEFRDVVAALSEFQRRDQGIESTLEWCGAGRRAGESRLFGQHHVHLRARTSHLDPPPSAPAVLGPSLTTPPTPPP